MVWVVLLFGLGISYGVGGSSGGLTYIVLFLITNIFFRKHLVLALTHLASRLGLIKETIHKMPREIHLTPATSPDSAAEQSLQALQSCGFENAGSWNIAELPKIKVSLMIHPKEDILGVVESASSIGSQVNLHILCVGGHVVSFTNSRLPAPRIQRPNVTRTRMPGVTPQDLVSHILKERPRSFKPLRVEEAPRLYEQLYAEEIAFEKQNNE